MFTPEADLSSQQQPNSMIYADVEVESETVDFGHRPSVHRSIEDVRTPNPEESIDINEAATTSATSSPTKVKNSAKVSCYWSLELLVVNQRPKRRKITPKTYESSLEIRVESFSNFPRFFAQVVAAVGPFFHQARGLESDAEIWQQNVLKGLMVRSVNAYV